MRSERRGFRARILATSSAAVIGVSIFAGAGPAFAQEEESSTERVVITGSRIQRQDYSANSPIVTVSESTFEETSTIGIETILNQLPQFVPALTQFTTGDIQPTATNTVGASTVSLRGLGSNRTLVLVDGRRATPVNSTLVVDTNSIPSAAIQRVEIISGGASAVYGADAVGGVVNFILKDDFEGFDLETRYGQTELGDGSEFQISGLFGANLASGRGNVMFGLEHATRGTAKEIDRDWSRQELADPYVTPSNFWFSETYVASRATNNTPTQAAIDQVFPLVPGQVARNSTFYINPTPDGTGTVFSGVRTFGGASGAAGSYKYDGPFESSLAPGVAFRKQHPDGSLGENDLFTYLSRPMERYSSFGRGRFELTDNITAIASGTFARSKSTTISQYTAALGSNSVIIPYGTEIYAPSLNADGTTNAAYRPGGAYGLNCAATGGCTESQAFPLPAEMQTLLNSRRLPNDDVTLNGNMDYLPTRQIFSSTTTYQALFGFEGVLGNDWVWDAHISHGETLADTTMVGDASRERYRAVASAPNFGRAFQQTGNPDFSGQRSGTARCTTGLPLIADFVPSEDCILAIGANLDTKQTIVQNVAEANLAGDAFELPAGMLSFAAGASYREYDFEYYVDNLNRFESFIENTMGARPSGDSFGAYDVGEIYGELLVPILRDLPFVEQLNLELGGRYSDYSTVGGVETYKILGDWMINDWARVRGGLNKATRAPNIGELYLSRVQIFSGAAAIMGDQCSENNQDGLYGAGPGNINGAQGAAFAKSICQGIMGPAAAQEYYGRAIADQPDPGGVGSPNTTGNPNLEPEDAETWTLGLVLDSPFDTPALSGLTASIDYFRIDITDMIATKNGDAIYQECLSPDFNPTGDPTTFACQSIVRDTVNGNALAVDTTYTNEGRAITEGIDVQLDWRSQFEDIGLSMIPGGLSLNVLASFNLKNTTQATSDSEVIEWKGTEGCALGLQCMGYDYRVFTTFNYFTGPFSASLRWQHYPSVLASQAATDPDTNRIGVPKAYNVFALTGSYRLNDIVTVRAGIENLLDKKPPLSGGNPDASGFPQSPTRAGGGTYDPLGRRYYVGVSASF
jgi:outer membrane receptor protein involved in Fe transport